MAGSWVLDPPLGVMKQQIVDETEIPADEIGTIGDPDHQSRDSAHNPESPPPAGNPDDEVDALDCPHDPDRGADMHVATEELRQAHAAGRDRRLRLVIFNGRQWSEYAKDGYPPYTWRPYYGSNQHTGHAHFERNDKYRDDLRPWEMGLGMSGLTDQDRSWIVAGSLADKDGRPYNVLHTRLRLIMDAEDEAAAAEWARAGWGARTEFGLEQLGTMLQALIDGGVSGTVDLSAEQMEQLAQRVAELVGPPLLAGLVEQLSALVFRASVPPQQQ